MDIAGTVDIVDLHSIMYLLILLTPLYMLLYSRFTFHNVSINSVLNFSIEKNKAYLHSIMYLLILQYLTIRLAWLMVFTFHNVSINSEVRDNAEVSGNANLHSIMYLLIPVLQLPLYHL